MTNVKKRGATLNDPSTINPNLNMKKPTTKITYFDD